MCRTEAIHRNRIIKNMPSEGCGERTVQHPRLRAGMEAEDMGGEAAEGRAMLLGRQRRRKSPDDFLADGGTWCPESCPPTLPGELCQPPRRRACHEWDCRHPADKRTPPPAGTAGLWEGSSTCFSKHARKTSQRLGKSFSSCMFYRDLHRDQRPFMAHNSFAFIK